MTEAAAPLAAIAGALGGLAIAWLAEIAAPTIALRLSPAAARGSEWIRRTLQPFRLAGAEGAVPTDIERLRLQITAGGVGFALGLSIFSTMIGFGLSIASAWLAGRSLVWRRARYRRRLDAGASAAALALADGLAAGHSVRGALVAAGPGLEGPVGLELRRVGRELEMGARTDRALERLRLRARSRRIALIVAAVRIQRRSGGSLAFLLREIAASIDEQDQLEEEANAASAQARFTSVVVLLLPLFGLLLGELAAPGMVGRMMGSALGLWLVGSAFALQLAGMLLIKRLSRVES